MSLFHQCYIDGEPENEWSTRRIQADEHAPVIIIPGLFGSTPNWRSFAKHLSTHLPVIVVDQRNHGQSPHYHSNSYDDLVSDLIQLMDQLELSKASLCGHSMGGKTAMWFALNQSERLERLLVLDIAPVKYSHSHAPILEGLKKVNLETAASRAEVEEQLRDVIPDKATRLFIMLSLAGKAGAFYWRLNVDALLNNISLIGDFPTVNEQKYHRKCLFIRGNDSNYVQDSHIERVKKYFSAAEIQGVDGAGHWLHVDKPAEVLEQAKNFLKKS